MIDIGSNAGLCLGISAITLVELLKLLAEILFAIMCVKKKVQPQTSKPPEHHDSDSDSNESSHET